MRTLINKSSYRTIKKQCRNWLPVILFTACFSGARAQNLNSPNKRGPLGTQVNAISGNVFIERTDVSIPARYFGLNIHFYYNSFLFNEDHSYGKGWTFQFNIKYRKDTTPGNRFILWGDGREDKFDSLPGGIYKAPRGFFSTLLQYQPNKYVVTQLNGVKCFFDNPVHKRVTRMEEPNGNFLNFTYTDSLLTGLSNAAGQSITFTYNPAGRLATVVDAIASPSRTFTYSYDETGNLKEVKDPLNGKYQYTYLVNGPMKTFTDKNNNTIDIIYFSDFTASELVGCNKRLSFSYDTTTKTNLVTDHLPTGNQVTKYTYQISDNLSWITSMSGNCCGFNVRYEYDEQGNNIKMTNANGQTYTYTYDEYGNRLSGTDPLGQVYTYTYTPDFKKISSFKDAKGNLYTMTYDAKGNLVLMTTPGNNIYSATYNTSGDIATSTDPKGNVYVYNYDSRGNPLTVSGPESYNAILSYDARGNLMSYTDARGNSSSAEYDILNRLKKITDPIHNNIQFDYDAAGNMTYFKNKNNETTLYSYDASNRLVAIAGPTGNQSSFTYDGMDNLLSLRDPLGYERKLTYDNLNRVKGTKDAENNSATYGYDGMGNITSVDLPTGRSIQYSYDALGRLMTAADASGTIAAYTYDKNGNTTSYTNGTGAVTTAIYDSLDRVIKVTDPLGNTISRTYDKNNNLTSITDLEGHTSYYTYDSRNRVKTYTDNNGYIITAAYDATDNLASLTDQNANVTTYTYDSLNRRKTMTYPNGKYREYAYDKEGNVISIRLTDATVITYQYDTLDRIVSRTLPGGEVYSYTYDRLDRVLTATNNTGTVTFTYDGMDRVTSENFDGRTTRYTYSVSGRTQTTIYPDSTIVTKEFDTRNRLVKILKDSSAVVDYAYNKANQLTSKTFANGVSTLMQYDFANRLSSIVTLNGTIQNTTFTYDKNYNKTAINRLNNPGLSEQFTYDNGYRLTQYKRGTSVQNTYSYDAVGNRISANLNGAATTYTTNNLNQLTSVNGSSFTFDDRANITFDGTFYKTYDSDNKLIKDSSSPASVITYAYDALGRRVMKTINGSVLKYTFSSYEIIEERDGSNSLLNRTLFANFLSPVMNEKNSNRFYYHANELGSVEAISSNSGRLLESYRYDPYGKLSRFDSTGNPLAASLAGNHIGFTGQEYDSDTKSYRFFFRNYSPETGVFNQRDLIEYGDGMGLYQYVSNNPANGVDVWGLDEIDDKYELPPGITYRVDLMYGGDPCYHDKNKIKLISKKVIEEQREMVLGNYGPQSEGFKGPMGDIWAGWSADSKFYRDFDGGDKFLGNNQFYFNGEQMANYEANYYFTSYLNASRGWSAPSVGTQVAVWNGLKAVGNAAMAKSIDPIISRAREMPAKMNASGQGYRDAQPGAADNIRMVDLAGKQDYESNEFGEWWPVINPQTGVMGYEFFPRVRIPSERVMAFRRYVKEHCQEDKGTKKRQRLYWDNEKKMWVLISYDPNEIIGPQGQPNKKWVSVKERMAYTILCENDKQATANARYIRISSPIEAKQDPSTFQLGGFGFNNQEFSVPSGLSSYYQRLDCRDSMGLYIDVVAGYDQIRNEIFWEFQSIDPVTLLPTEDPLKGLLFLQDSMQPNYGHGYVTFTIKPKSNSSTLDTIGARARIVFDDNDTIPTNIYTNTIDALPPTSSMDNLPDFTPNTAITINYTGADDAGGCGINSYSIYVSDNDGSPQLYAAGLTRMDTTFYGTADHKYKFYLSATDSVGNVEVLKLLDSVRITSGEQVICPNGSTTFDAKHTGGAYQWQVDNGTGFTNITEGGLYSGVTTSVLSLTNAPSSMYGYQYRCVINSNPSTEIFLLKFGMNWEGTVSNAWGNPANWSCSSLPDANTDVIISGSKPNYPVVNSNVTIRTLRMTPGASGTVNSGFTLTILK